MSAGPEGHGGEGKGTWQLLAESFAGFETFLSSLEAPSAGLKVGLRPRSARPRGRAEVHTCKAITMNTQESSSLLWEGGGRPGAEGSPAPCCCVSLLHHAGEAWPSPQ